MFVFQQYAEAASEIYALGIAHTQTNRVSSATELKF